jgi:plastocyanin
MRPIRALSLGLVAVVLAACAGTVPGWTYAPAPPATPLPSFDEGVASAPPGESAAPSAAASAAPSAAAGGATVEIAAQNIAFDKAELQVPADTPFQIIFANNDPGVPHNVAIHEGTPTGPEVFQGEIFPGVETRTYDVPALAAGAYGFVCTVHPNMIGTLTAS